MSQKKQKRSPRRNRTCLIMLQGMIILVLILFLLSPLGLPRIYNSISLFTFSQRFYAYPLPPETTVISRSSEYGAAGNGHSCSFLATFLVTTTLTEQEVRDYYANVTFATIHPISPAAGGWGLNGRIRPTVNFISPTTAEIRLFDGVYAGFRSRDGKCS